MIAAHSPQWRLSAEQVDHLWELLGLGEYPFPISVPSHGATLLDRLRSRERVYRQLRHTGLLSQHGRIDAELEQALRMLSVADCSIDSVWEVKERPGFSGRVLGVCTGDYAVLGVQSPGESVELGDTLLLQHVHPQELIGALLAELPATPPGRHAEVCVAAAAQESTAPGVLIPGTPHMTDQERNYQRCQDILGAKHLAAGQLAVTARCLGQTSARSSVLRWFDNADDGRYLLTVTPATSSTPTLTVRPAEPAELSRQITALVHSVAGHSLLSTATTFPSTSALSPRMG